MPPTVLPKALRLVKMLETTSVRQSERPWATRWGCQLVLPLALMWVSPLETTLAHR